jgi:alpha-galactosidase
VEYENLTPDEQTNAWRHYYIHDVMRKIDGELTPTYRGIGNMSAGMTTKKELLMLKAYRANGVTPDVIWMDAGWYTGADGESVPWTSTGSLDIDYNRFPDGLSDIGSYAKNTDAMYLLWFEPENMRLNKEAFLAGQPDFKEEWLLGKPGGFLEGLLMDLGNPECREWIFQKICKVIDQSGATGYRQDFNNDPAPAWAENDAKTEGRTGMTENQYVQGYLALWDALIDKYGLFIDSCASGGGRNDLETMKRGVPLHYTDWFDGNNEDYDMKGKMTQALFAWFPYFKNEIYESTNMYKVRMNYAPLSLMNFGPILEKNPDWTMHKQGHAEFEQIRGYFYADYYQLVEWTAEADRWNAWEFYDPATASGYAAVFCHEATTELSTTVKLKGLDPEKTYRVTDFDGLVDVTADGAALMESGIPVTVPEKPYAIIMLIKPAE